jgi:threonine dehydratase
MARLLRSLGVEPAAMAGHSVGEYVAAALAGVFDPDDGLRLVAERGALMQSLDDNGAMLAVTLPEERGSFRRFLQTLDGLPGGPRNITEFNYRISDASRAHIFVGLNTAGRGESPQIAAHFNQHGFAAIDLTHNELAKEHVRYMVGGRSQLAGDERLLRFEFPERPGALMKFLDLMKPGWNISLFHYRNQGADFGRVLVGIQAPPSSDAALRKFLAELGYPWVDETDNPAYRLFL